MKSLGFLAGILILVSASASAATEGAWRRTCQIQGGLPWDIQLEDDQISLCRFGGLGVDVESFYNRMEHSGTPQAVEAFLSQNQPGSADSREACESSGGTYLPARDLDGNAVALCQFADDSRIEARALSVGSSSDAGSALACALQR
jgi:putative hemolysin